MSPYSSHVAAAAALSSIVDSWAVAGTLDEAEAAYARYELAMSPLGRDRAEVEFLSGIMDEAIERLLEIIDGMEQDGLSDKADHIRVKLGLG